VEILKRFQMLNNKPMPTSMVPNLKSTCYEDSDLSDPTLYRQLIESLMYLVNTSAHICYVVNTESIHG